MAGSVGNGGTVLESKSNRKASSLKRFGIVIQSIIKALESAGLINGTPGLPKRISPLSGKINAEESDGVFDGLPAEQDKISESGTKNPCESEATLDGLVAEAHRISSEIKKAFVSDIRKATPDPITNKQVNQLQNTGKAHRLLFVGPEALPYFAHCRHKY
jgi:hypothetical protein